ncbi:MAG: hypothetical protein JWM81_288 [Candidatus Saccharibacteria bacterium]|nr:hypothetical protein [Candidatus Saccharibacteria bacterium]
MPPIRDSSWNDLPKPSSRELAIHQEIRAKGVAAWQSAEKLLPKRRSRFGVNKSPVVVCQKYEDDDRFQTLVWLESKGKDAKAPIAVMANTLTVTAEVCRQQGMPVTMAVIDHHGRLIDEATSNRVPSQKLIILETITDSLTLIAEQAQLERYRQAGHTALRT